MAQNNASGLDDAHNGRLVSLCGGDAGPTASVDRRSQFVSMWPEQLETTYSSDKHCEQGQNRETVSVLTSVKPVAENELARIASVKLKVNVSDVSDKLNAAITGADESG